MEYTGRTLLASTKIRFTSQNTLGVGQARVLLNRIYIHTFNEDCEVWRRTKCQTLKSLSQGQT